MLTAKLQIPSTPVKRTYCSSYTVFLAVIRPVVRRLCNCSVEVEKPCHTNMYGFQFLPASGRCHGVGCANAPELQEDPDEMES